MQVTPILTLYEQARKTGRITTPSTLGDSRYLKSLSHEERREAFEGLVKLLGGTLYVLFNANGAYCYAVADSPQAAAGYVRNFRQFKPMLYSTERLRSCGGNRGSKEIFNDAFASNQETLLERGYISVERWSKHVATMDKNGGKEIDPTKPLHEPVQTETVKEFADPSAERDTFAMLTRKVAKPKEPTPPKVVEHPLQRQWPLNAFGRW